MHLSNALTVKRSREKKSTLIDKLEYKVATLSKRYIRKITIDDKKLPSATMRQSQSTNKLKKGRRASVSFSLPLCSVHGLLLQYVEWSNSFKRVQRTTRAERTTSSSAGAFSEFPNSELVPGGPGTSPEGTGRKFGSIWRIKQVSNKWAVAGRRAQNTRADLAEAGRRLNCEAPALPTTCRGWGCAFS